VTGTVDGIILLMASASILTALFFGLRARRLRSRSAQATYGVAQQERRRAMQVDLVRGIVAVFLGLILFGVVGLSPRPETNEVPDTRVTPTPEATLAAPPTVTPTATSVPAEPAVSPSDTPLPEATATSPLSSETPTEEPAPTLTPSPSPPATATVKSEVGVWLRSIPSVEGEQLEWLLDGTIVTLLPGLESADELEWQQVISPNGVAGWVAVPFIAYNE
jgi:hypothetical protein